LGKNVNTHVGEKNINESSSPLSSSPSPQSSDMTPTLMDSIPSKEVHDPKESESINDSTSPKIFQSLLLMLLNPLVHALIDLRGRRYNLILIGLGRHSPKSRSTFSSLMQYNKCLLCLFSQRFVHHQKGTNVPKRVFLASNASSTISNQVPLKCKDQEAPKSPL